MSKTIFLKAKTPSARLDKFLVLNLDPQLHLSRAMIQKLIKTGQVLINQEVVLVQKTPVSQDDEVQVTLLNPQPSKIVGEAMNLEILYQDADLLVLNKPNNLVVHPGAGNQEKTLVHGLVNQVQDLSGIGGEVRPGIVHRLDKQTSGLMVVAKNDATHQKLSKMFATNQVYKEYLVLVWGVIEVDGGVIEAPIGRSSTNRKKMVVTEKNAKFAKTRFQVLERFKNATLISCVLETGRTHQIRVHLNFIKHPVLNDPVYGKRNEKRTSYGQYLYAAKLVFRHPSTNEEMEFQAPLPPEFNDKIKALREEK